MFVYDNKTPSIPFYQSGDQVPGKRARNVSASINRVKDTNLDPMNSYGEPEKENQECVNLLQNNTPEKKLQSYSPNHLKAPCPNKDFSSNSFPRRNMMTYFDNGKLAFTT